MNSHGKDNLEMFDDQGEEIFHRLQAEESVTEISIQNTGMEGDKRTCPKNPHGGRPNSLVEFTQVSAKANVKERGSMYLKMTKPNERDPNSLLESEGHLVSQNCDAHYHHMPNSTKFGNSEPQFTGVWNFEEENPMTQQISRTNQSETSVIAKTEKNISILDPIVSSMSTSEIMLPQKSYGDNDQFGNSDVMNSKDGRYFYYDAPLYEDTGSWIPVSVPPMSEREHEEWTRGFCSNGGYIPEGELRCSQCIGEDKELTMWDVVLEMLLVARGKVSSLASCDIGQISWISPNLIEQAWTEMAQTLTDATLSNTREILEPAPPKWLPDSTTSSCMLCSVRFHPIMCTRHHCRFCGGIFCSRCTKGRSLLPEKFRTGDPQRVCDVCCVRLEPVQPYLMDQVSCAAQLPTRDLTDLSTLRSWVNFPWGQAMENEIYKATNTIRGYSKVGSLKPEKRIPEAILQNAKGLAILTVVKVGMMVTYNIGTGLVVARREDGSWSPPSAISSLGVGWGAQAGGELIDFVIVLRTNDAVKTFCSDAHLSIGAGLSAAIGIIGRTAEADVRAGPSGIAACYTYSSSKGAFIGCSLEGSIVTIRARENSRFYGSQSITVSDILLGSLPRPPAAATLYRALGDLYQQLER